jgi:hypothetical protein
MSLPVPPNTTCDIYRVGNAPPAAPDVAAVACHLRPDWLGGQESGDRALAVALVTWTHILLVDVAVDIRDAYTGGLAAAEQDSVYIPDKNGTRFKVAFSERVFRGQTQDHKRVYLDRQTPTWPTNEV